jgi:hypothetical protein
MHPVQSTQTCNLWLTVGPEAPHVIHPRGGKITGGESSPSVRCLASGWAPLCSPQRGESGALDGWAGGVPVRARRRRWRSGGAACWQLAATGHTRARGCEHELRGTKTTTVLKTEKRERGRGGSGHVRPWMAAMVPWWRRHPNRPYPGWKRWRGRLLRLEQREAERWARASERRWTTGDVFHRWGCGLRWRAPPAALALQGRGKWRRGWVKERGRGEAGGLAS